MAHNSKEMINKSLDEMARVFAHAEDETLIKGFLECLLTKNELDEVTSRWELVKLIDAGMSQRKIAQKLGLSLCKITRGSKELKKEGSAFATCIEMSKQLEQNR
jgi:TrpR family transcriptional regulator, trp operon repressor